MNAPDQRATAAIHAASADAPMRGINAALPQPPTFATAAEERLHLRHRHAILDLVEIRLREARGEEEEVDARRDAADKEQPDDADDREHQTELAFLRRARRRRIGCAAR